MTTMIRPEEGTHRKVSLVSQVTLSRQSIIGEKAVELPLGHVLVVLSGVPRVVKGHLEAAHALHLSVFHDDIYCKQL